MRTITGAILLFAAQQSYANAYLVGFPYHTNVKDVLVPASVVFAVLGVAYLGWGLLTESRSND